MKMKLFKEERVNPKAGTEGLHFVVTQDDTGDTVLHVFDSEDQAGLYHGQLRGYGGVKRIGRLKGSKSMSFGYINDGVAKQFGAEPRMIRHDQGETNPRGVYTTYSAWRAAAKKAGAVRFEGDKDIAQAFDATGFGVAEWDGAEGYIYRKSQNNPRQRIAVSLSKSRRRNPVYDTGSDE
jgi:hypothetical protein